MFIHDILEIPDSSLYFCQMNNKALLNQNITSSKPFLKWAGGKTQLLPELRKHVPANYGRYIEPFVGGGAFFFDLCPHEAIISDSNEELIITYKIVRDRVRELIEALRDHKNEEDYYYKIRSKKPVNLSLLDRASRFIYLNKTCFNGLYRVNKKNEFNVPFGRRKNPTICDEVTLLRSSDCLQNTTIIHGDYLEVLRKHARPNDFIFIDPPYVPVGEYADFKRYTKEFFYKDDHVKLRDEFVRLYKSGCFPLLTNSVTPFVQELYSGFEQYKIKTKRLISSKASTRNGHDLIVKGGKW